ncbi:MAG: hypothetical protein K2O21_02785 [Malacoplasma sp.]|nr:hypothetical protein [Malacoplasma sp.]MDE7088173.1 hypothetical protein [Malacoplasma sp.]
MNNSKKTKSINEGYVKYNKDNSKSSLNTYSSEIIAQAEKIEKDKKAKQPKGYLSLGFIIFVTILVFLFCFFVNNENQSMMPWSDCLLVAFAIGFFLNLFWLVWRQQFGLKSKFAARQMLDIVTYRDFREKKNWVLKTPWNDIKTFNDYQEYSATKKKSTTKIFYISLTSYTVLFIISIIISLTVR